MTRKQYDRGESAGQPEGPLAALRGKLECRAKRLGSARRDPRAPGGLQVHVEEWAPGGERTKRESTTDPRPELSGISATERHEPLAQNKTDYEGTQSSHPQSHALVAALRGREAGPPTMRWSGDLPSAVAAPATRTGEERAATGWRYRCGEGGAGVQSGWPASALVRL